ncbi:chloride channel protein [Flaviaesturariibacter flavus]|nr:chloride channel protein [Flaviaesturariibacter flavus]
MRSKAGGPLQNLLQIRVGAHARQALPLWIASLLTGLVAVAYTRLFGLCESVLHYELRQQPWMIFILAPSFFLLAWGAVRLFAPGARGSGIPQVMAAIELSQPGHEEKISRLLSIRILLTKVLSSLLMVVGGGAIGREGPTIQIVGSIFNTISNWVPRAWTGLSRQSFLLTGAAAGLAAAFNTPLGGLVFGMEELARIHVRFFRTALFTSVIIAGLAAQGFLGPYLYLGYPDVSGLGPKIFLGVIFVAVVAGAAGALMCRAILAVMRWKKRLNPVQTVAFVVLAGLLFAGIAYFVDEQVLGSGKDLLNRTLFTADKHCGISTVLARMLGPVLCFNTRAAGGVFAPSLSGGAAVGSLCAGLLHLVGSNANILILCGMVAFLTGVTQTPFTSAILVLEMTDRHSVIFHLLLAALFAGLAARVISRRSFYEVLKHDYLEEANAQPEGKTLPGTTAGN